MPRADDYFDYMKSRAFDLQPTAQLLSFGPDGGSADARLCAFESRGEQSLGAADILGERVKFSLNAVGAHWGANAVLALLVGRLSGMTLKQAADALEGVFASGWTRWL